jgi:hypothetical protein
MREDSPVGVGLAEVFDKEAEVGACGEVLAESSGEGAEAAEVCEEGAKLRVAAVVSIESGVEFSGFIPGFADEVGEGTAVDGRIVYWSFGGVEGGAAEISGVIEGSGRESAVGISRACVEA